MRRWLQSLSIVVGFAAAFLPVSVSAQAPASEAPAARLQRLSGIDARAAQTFIDTLRRTLGMGEKHDVCALVTFPLAQPGGPVRSIAECEQKYDDIFTVPVRRAVGKSQFDSLFPTPDGLLVGFGELWIGKCSGPGCAGDALRITQVNGSAEGTLKPPRGKTLVACAAPGAQVRVVADGSGGAELLLWPEPGGDPTALIRPPADGAAPPGPPTSTLKSQPAGRPDVPQCAFRNWTFEDDTATYSVVTDLGCLKMTGANGVPPMGSVAQVVRVTPQRGRETLWCVE